MERLITETGQTKTMEETGAGVEPQRGSVDEALEDSPGMEFDEDIFVGGRERKRLTRSQKRAARTRHAVQVQDDRQGGKGDPLGSDS